MISVRALKLRAHIGALEDALADSFAQDLDAGPDDIRPGLIAASMTAALAAVRDRLEAAAGHDEVMEILDEVLEFVRGGLEATRAR